MAERLKLRNIATVGALFEPKERDDANDIPSDGEEDNVEKFTDSESEEEAFQSDAEEPDEDQFLIKTEEEEEDTQPSASKRRRTSARDTESFENDKKSNILQGKDGYLWQTSSPEKQENVEKPVSSFLPGPVGEARNAKTPFQAWSLLFDEVLLEKIILHTNEEIARYRNSLETKAVSDNIYNNLGVVELRAFIGLLYFSGLQKTSNTNIDDLWSFDYGSVMYRATMAQRRFEFISRMIRFDDKTTRQEGRESDKFAPIREIWDDFISNCTKYYKPAFNCTIDEQLLSFRGRCPFKVYNGSSPEKYGIKIVMLNDSTTFYMHNAEPYVGKVVTEEGENLQFYYVRKLSESLHGTARNLTCDSWFSSVSLFDKMLKNHCLTMVGCLKKNHDEIPYSFRRAGKVSASKFAFDETKTLVSHTVKKQKIVILLSTLHHSAEVDDVSRKPEILKFYEATKGVTATFDKMCHEFTTARKTLRWPMRVWMGMLDQAGINAMVLYNFNVNNRELIRRSFMKTLIRELVDPHLRARLNSLYLRRNLRLVIEEILGIEPAAIVPRPGPGKVARCTFCPRSSDRKSRVACATCHRPVCEDHRTVQCINCLAHD